MKVKNIRSIQGNRIANQFEMIDDKGFEWFQSYDSIIAVKIPNHNGIILDEYYWDYSRTTSKYRNIFLNMNTQEIKKAIKKGDIKLMDLNCDNPLKDVVYQSWGYEVFECGGGCVDNWYQDMGMATHLKKYYTEKGDSISFSEDNMFLELIKYRCLVTNFHGCIDEIDRITKGKSIHTAWKVIGK